MIKKLMQGLVRAELEEQQRANLKIVLLVYGAVAAAAGLFGIGGLIKDFLERVENIEKKLAMLDGLVQQEERREAQERAVNEAYELLGKIESAKKRVAEHEAEAKQTRSEYEAVRELGRQRMMRSAQ